MTGFSRLMGEDESRAVAALGRIRSVFTERGPAPRRHARRAGRRLLRGAVRERRRTRCRPRSRSRPELAGAPGPAGDPVRIRIGVHMGDVVRSGSEILGDSVNVAARLQTIAAPGRHHGVRRRLPRRPQPRRACPSAISAPKTLKNIRDKMRVYELHVEEVAGRRRRSPAPLRAPGRGSPPWRSRWSPAWPRSAIGWRRGRRSSAWSPVDRAAPVAGRRRRAAAPRRPAPDARTQPRHRRRHRRHGAAARSRAGCATPPATA